MNWPNKNITLPPRKRRELRNKILKVSILKGCSFRPPFKMWNIKLSKFKQFYALTFLPRLFLKESKYLRNNFNVKHLTALRKSTAPNVKNEEPYAFTFDNDLQKGDEITLSVRSDLLNGNIIAPKYYQIPPCTKCQSVISKLFGINTQKKPNVDDKGIKVQATTATIEQEKLAQKIEIVDETPHVEAHPSKIEGFNTSTKILGQNVSKFDSSKEKISTVNQSVSADELAKRCLDTSIADIDKILLNELKNVTKIKSTMITNIDYVRKFKNLTKDSVVLGPNDNSGDGEIYMYRSEEGDSQFKVEKIQPLHLDTLPLFTVDDGTKDFKATGYFRGSPPVLKATIEETAVEAPSQLSPYDQQAMPFYEYTNKEHILEDDPELETAAITETIRETEFEIPIQAQETIQKNPLDQRNRTLGNPETEEPLRPTPTVNVLYEPLLTFHDEVDQFSKTFRADHVSNIFVTQQLLTSTDHPGWRSGHPSWRPDGITMKDENTAANSAISATLPNPPKSVSSGQQMEAPSNTAISANQNPGEYFDWKMPVEFSSNFPLNAYSNTPRLLIEHSVTRNMVFSSLPELKESRSSPQISGDMVDTSAIPREPECLKHVVHPTDIADLKNVPLSIILKRIQEQSKLEYCRELFAKAKADVMPFHANKPNCPPPPSNKPPKAGPCKPIPKPKDDNPCPCPKKCPDKKDPCAKFVPFFFNVLYKTYTTTDLKIAIQCTGTTLFNKTKINTPALALLTEDVIESLKRLGRALNMSANSDNPLFARGFEPWIPIPSFPYPKIDEKRPFVCPKDGCKDPKARKSCKDKQNISESRKNMISHLMPSCPLFLPTLPTCAN